MPKTKKSPDSIIKAKAKTWIKHHAPEYIAKRKDYAKKPSVKQTRNAQSKTRRTGNSALLALIKDRDLLDKEGNVYKMLHNRLVRNEKQVVRRARDGTLHFMDYDNEEDLKSSKFDEKIVNELDEKLYQTIEKFMKGDEELEELVMAKKVITETKMAPEECFWKNMTDEEKKELLKKLKVEC